MFAGVLTIKSALARTARWYAKSSALIEGDHTVSYQAFGENCRRIANGYRRLGAAKGDRIAFLCQAGAEHTAAYYASHYIGAIAVNLHFRETLDHQLALLRRLQPKILLFDYEKQTVARQLARSLPGIRLVQNATSGLSEEATLADLLAESDDEPPCFVYENDPAVIQLSSGSTGSPKALVHTHASVLESWSGGLYMWSGIAPHDRFLNAFAPSFTVWIVHPGSFLAHGATVIFIKPWDAQSFLKTIEREAVTCTALTSTQWRAVLALGDASHDSKTLRMAAYLGEKIAPEHLRALTERICPVFCSFYGMSECLGIGGCVIRSTECLKLDKWASVGRPTLNSDLRVIDQGGTAEHPKSVGEVGEIVVRAASFATEDWGDSAWQKRVLTSDGWYRTGDLGFVDGDGYVYLTGRVDNVINTGGIKVAAEEIEQILARHPDVAAAAVIGAADENWGERVIAFIVPRRPQLTSDELSQWCRKGDRLAGFKCPKEWHLLDRMPQNSVGKLDRNALRQLARDPSRRAG